MDTAGCEVQEGVSGWHTVTEQRCHLAAFQFSIAAISAGGIHSMRDKILTKEQVANSSQSSHGFLFPDEKVGLPWVGVSAELPVAGGQQVFLCLSQNMGRQKMRRLGKSLAQQK